MRSSAARARSGFPAFMSQRGDSGTKNIRTRNASAGTSSAPNIQRQPICPFQLSTIICCVAPGSTGSAIIRLIN